MGSSMSVVGYHGIRESIKSTNSVKQLTYYPSGITLTSRLQVLLIVLLCLAIFSLTLFGLIHVSLSVRGYNRFISKVD